MKNFILFIGLLVCASALAQVSGGGGVSSAPYNPNNVNIKGGTIDNTTIGGTTPSTGAFTALSASGAVSGVGFSNLFASPFAIGGTTPAAGTFSSLTANKGGGAISGPTIDGVLRVTNPTYGAKCDGQVIYTATVPGGSTSQLVSDSALNNLFSPNDCNVTHGGGCTGTADKSCVLIPYTSSFPFGNNPTDYVRFGTVQGYTDANDETCVFNADPRVQNRNNSMYVWGTDDRAAIQAAINAAKAINTVAATGFTGTKVQLPAGVCVVGQGTSNSNTLTIPDGVALEGVGYMPIDAYAQDFRYGGTTIVAGGFCSACSNIFIRMGDGSSPSSVSAGPALRYLNVDTSNQYPTAISGGTTLTSTSSRTSYMEHLSVVRGGVVTGPSAHAADIHVAPQESGAPAIQLSGDSTLSHSTVMSYGKANSLWTNTNTKAACAVYLDSASDAKLDDVHAFVNAADGITSNANIAFVQNGTNVEIDLDEPHSPPATTCSNNLTGSTAGTCPVVNGDANGLHTDVIRVSVQGTISADVNGTWSVTIVGGSNNTKAKYLLNGSTWNGTHSYSGVGTATFQPSGCAAQVVFDSTAIALGAGTITIDQLIGDTTPGPWLQVVGTGGATGRGITVYGGGNQNNDTANANILGVIAAGAGASPQWPFIQTNIDSTSMVSNVTINGTVAMPSWQTAVNGQYSYFLDNSASNANSIANWQLSGNTCLGCAGSYNGSTAGLVTSNNLITRGSVYAITAIGNSGGVCQITTPDTTGIVSGDTYQVSGSSVPAGCKGRFQVGSLVASTPGVSGTFNLLSSTYAAGYTSGGTVTATYQFADNLNPLVQNANLVYAGPTSGSAASPTFRNLVAADIPGAGSNINAQTGTTYQVVAGDDGKVITLTNAGAITVTLADPAVVGAGIDFWLENIGATTVTVNRKNADVIFGPGLTQAGVTTLTLPYSGTAVGLYNVSAVHMTTDGTNWYVDGVRETHGSQLFTGNGTWTAPAGVTQAWFSGAAPGGGGGGSAAANAAGGGGGSGQATIKQLIAVVPGTAYTVTVPPGGAGGVAGNNNGTTGSNLTVGAILTLTGGSGGFGAATGAVGAGGAAGGALGTAGAAGFEIAATFAMPGGGGSNPFGAIQTPAMVAGASSANGAAGGGYGAGGNGGTSGATGGTASGGAGAPGMIYIEW